MAATPRDNLPRRIIDPVLVTEAVAQMATEQAACRTCQEVAAYRATTGKEKMEPAHFHAYVRDGVLYQSPCESSNRVFDPATRSFVGRAHCSCDQCF